MVSLIGGTKSNAGKVKDRLSAHTGLVIALAGCLLVAGACGDDGGHELPMIPPHEALSPLPETRACGAGLSADATSLPRRLSRLGCFTSLVPLRPGPDLVPFQVRSALWTDAAEKHRYLAIPAGETIDTTDDVWELPPGSIVLKVFSLSLVDSSSARALEVRVIARTTRTWLFATYRVLEGGSDAVRVDASVTLDLQLADGRELSYYLPDTEACLTCHDEQTGPLAVRTRQLAGVTEYADGRADQLEVLDALGLLNELPSNAAPQPSPADPGAPLEARARSYLDANCASCHRPGGWTPPDLGIDLRYETPTAETGTCGVPLAYTSLWVPGEVRIVPGSPESSNLWRRLSSRGLGQMPPVGTAIVDPVGSDVVASWIRSLSRCP